MAFQAKDLFTLEHQQTIDPDDLGKLKEPRMFSFVVPMQNIKLQGYDFNTSVRKAIFEIFRDNQLGDKEEDFRNSLLNTIKWLIFREYSDKNGQMQITCPNPYCNERLTFTRRTDNYLDEKNDFIQCSCGNVAYITDCFELHDLVDDISGAGKIASYIMSALNTQIGRASCRERV